MNYYRCRLGCGCHRCYKQPTNPSNKTVVVPVSGSSAYEEWKSYNPDSTWSEAEWLEKYVAGSSMYSETEW